jgi:iron complex outermembrane receptor protein
MGTGYLRGISTITLAIASAMVVPTTASAQQSAAEGSSTPADGEITVTARRQNERLIDVPASVSVLSAETLANTGAKVAAEFVQLTPGVTIVTGNVEAADTQINIRGMNGARDAESYVALVVDGILKTNTSSLNQDQGALTQVEVLKGP